MAVAGLMPSVSALGCFVGPESIPNAEVILIGDRGVTTGATFTWADQCPKGNNVSQSTAGQQPTTSANWGGSGRTALQFDGVNDSLFRATLASGTVAQPTTMVAVFETAGSASPNPIADSRDVSNRQLVSESNAFIGHYAGAYIQCTRTYSAPERVIYTGIFNGASSSGRARRSGLSTLTQSGNPSTGSINGLTIGNAFNDTAAFGGKIAAFFLYRSALTSDQYLMLENWLVSYYSFT